MGYKLPVRNVCTLVLLQSQLSPFQAEDMQDTLQKSLATCKNDETIYECIYPPTPPDVCPPIQHPNVAPAGGASDSEGLYNCPSAPPLLSNVSPHPLPPVNVAPPPLPPLNVIPRPLPPVNVAPPPLPPLNAVPSQPSILNVAPLPSLNLALPPPLPQCLFPNVAPSPVLPHLGPPTPLPTDVTLNGASNCEEDYEYMLSPSLYQNVAPTPHQPLPPDVAPPPHPASPDVVPEETTNDYEKVIEALKRTFNQQQMEAFARKLARWQTPTAPSPQTELIGQDTYEEAATPQIKEIHEDADNIDEPDPHNPYPDPTPSECKGKSRIMITQ